MDLGYGIGSPDVVFSPLNPADVKSDKGVLTPTDFVLALGLYRLLTDKVPDMDDMETDRTIVTEGGRVCTDMLTRDEVWKRFLKATFCTTQCPTLHAFIGALSPFEQFNFSETQSTRLNVIVECMGRVTYLAKPFESRGKLKKSGALIKAFTVSEGMLSLTPFDESPTDRFTGLGIEYEGIEQPPAQTWGVNWFKYKDAMYGPRAGYDLTSADAALACVMFHWFGTYCSNMELPKHVAAEVYPDGRVKSFSLKKLTTVDGVECLRPFLRHAYCMGSDKSFPDLKNIAASLTREQRISFHDMKAAELEYALKGFGTCRVSEEETFKACRDRLVPAFIIDGDKISLARPVKSGDPMDDGFELMEH